MRLVNLEVSNGRLMVTVGTVSGRHGFDRYAVAALLEAYSRGEGATLRYFAEHGELPPEPPVWPALSVSPSADGWSVWHRTDGERLLIALVAQEGGRWMCSMQYATCSRHYGDTPQQAVDAARAWLSERWGLST